MLQNEKKRRGDRVDPSVTLDTTGWFSLVYLSTPWCTENELHEQIPL